MWPMNANPNDQGSLSLMGEPLIVAGEMRFCMAPRDLGCNIGSLQHSYLMTAPNPDWLASRLQTSSIRNQLQGSLPGFEPVAHRTKCRAPFARNLPCSCSGACFAFSNSKLKILRRPDPADAWYACLPLSSGQGIYAISAPLRYRSQDEMVWQLRIVSTPHSTLENRYHICASLSSI